MYKKWCENVEALEEAIIQVERDLRIFISKKNEANVYSHTKLYSYLLICWCEARIIKLAYEPEFNFTNKRGIFTKKKSFSDSEILEIITQATLKDKWLHSLRIAISKAYNVTLNDKLSQNLPFTARSRYKVIEDLINHKLLPSIELRNRIAHGQWKHAFTNDLKSFSQELTSSLRKENIVDLQLNHGIFKILAQLIHDIASSPTTFERDFDNNYQKLEQNILNLNKRTYKDYCKELVERYERGKNWKEKNLTKSS